MDSLVNIDNLTFVITTFKSEETIHNCLDMLPNNVNKIVIENSNNQELKINLEQKYQNLKCFVMSDNVGYGKANNYGINKAQSDYIFILNPDTLLLENTLNDLFEALRGEDFSIAAPIDSNEKFKYKFNNKGLAEVDFVKGFAIIINKKKMFNQFFDENFFLYLEEIDLCRNVKNKNGRIIIVNTPVKHLGGLSHGNRYDLEMEKSRNWHWMWSTFYYNKKHNGYLYGLVKTLPNFFSSFLKFLIFKLIKKNSKETIYKMRILGLLNSYRLKKSSYRPYNKIK